MEDLNEKLAEILNDPESMNRVRKMAESLLGNQRQEDTPPPAPPILSNNDNGGISGGDELRAVMNIMSRLKNEKNDSRTQLLLALKPHLSEPKQAKVDTAVKILRLLDLLPYLKESGVLNLLM